MWELPSSVCSFGLSAKWRTPWKKRKCNCFWYKRVNCIPSYSCAFCRVFWPVRWVSPVSRDALLMFFSHFSRFFLAKKRVVYCESNGCVKPLVWDTHCVPLLFDGNLKEGRGEVFSLPLPLLWKGSRSRKASSMKVRAIIPDFGLHIYTIMSEA